MSFRNKPICPPSFSVLKYSSAQPLRDPPSSYFVPIFITTFLTTTPTHRDTHTCPLLCGCTVTHLSLIYQYLLSLLPSSLSSHHLWKTWRLETNGKGWKSAREKKHPARSWTGLGGQLGRGRQGTAAGKSQAIGFCLPEKRPCNLGAGKHAMEFLFPSTVHSSTEEMRTHDPPFPTSLAVGRADLAASHPWSS